MTKSTITREQLHERARENVKALKMASRQHAFESARQEILADLQLAELALAAMDSEPVGEFYEDGPLNWYQLSDGDRVPDSRRIPLYRHAQPAPVVPDEMTIRDACKFVQDMRLFDDVSVIVMRTWNACRAAMLQERQKSAGVSNNCRSNENVQDLQAGNSPVIPDGYVMVPIDATRAMIDAARRVEEDGYDAMHKAMLAAAPQPQNEPQNIPEIIPQWIPVSERLPEDDDFVYIWPRPDFGVELHVGQYCECSPKGEGWYAQVYEQNYGIEWHPITVTHWMPPPCAPQEVR
ncbi:DUF551 domain-containing protein [Raoultella planticola]|uniref:DUF551 domain-containing protein n=1 Tax=Raoultella planticola TaxID=575 RepID=UPI00388F46F7